MRRHMVVGVLLVSLLTAGCGGSTPSATVASSSRTPVPTPSPSPEPTPHSTQAAGLDALVIPLGSDTAPIDILEAEGSVWVALHHGNAVVRLDPETGEEIARIPTGPNTGPGWFTVGDGSIWVTNQNGTGVSRIDPVTNTVIAAIGADAPCGPPAFYEDSVWITACDKSTLVRYDASTNAKAETIAMAEPVGLIVIDDELWGVGESGIYRFDAASRTMRRESRCCGAVDPPASRGSEMWTGQDAEGLVVLNVPDLERLARVPIEAATTMALGRGAAWIVSRSGGSKLTQVDLPGYRVRETYQFGVGLADVAIVGDRVWVSDFDVSQIWVITPP